MRAAPRSAIVAVAALLSFLASGPLLYGLLCVSAASWEDPRGEAILEPGALLLVGLAGLAISVPLVWGAFALLRSSGYRRGLPQLFILIGLTLLMFGLEVLFSVLTGIRTFDGSGALTLLIPLPTAALVLLTYAEVANLAFVVRSSGSEPDAHPARPQLFVGAILMLVLSGILLWVGVNAAGVSPELHSTDPAWIRPAVTAVFVALGLSGLGLTWRIGIQLMPKNRDEGQLA